MGQLDQATTSWRRALELLTQLGLKQIEDVSVDQVQARLDELG